MIVLHYGSGSGPAWRVWLALEHKQLPHELKVHSFSKGDLKQPEFLAINPRGKVPTIVDGDFTLYESIAIVEYLDQAYPDSGKPLFPRDARRAAIARRIVQEADAYFAPAVAKLTRETLMRKGEPDVAARDAARASVIDELDRLESYLQGDWFAGELSAADFTVYPVVALVKRIGERQPENRVALPPKLDAWSKRVEALPFLAKTWPPHWK